MKFSCAHRIYAFHQVFFFVCYFFVLATHSVDLSNAAHSVFAQIDDEKKKTNFNQG